MIGSDDIPETKPAFVDCSSLLVPKVETDLDGSYDVVPVIDAMSIDETTDYKHNEEQQHPTLSILPTQVGISANKRPKRSKRYTKKTYSLEECHTSEDGNPIYYCYLCFKT